MNSDKAVRAAHPRDTRASALVVGTLAFVGCALPKSEFRQQHFRHHEYPYVVQYSDDKRSLAAPEWRLDNYIPGENTPKTKGEYGVQRSYDLDGDGLAEETRSERFYDIRLDHRVRDARIWVRTVPVDSGDARRDLRALAERYVHGSSGAGTVTVRYGTEITTGVERRFATRVLSETPCYVSGASAYRVDFEVANVDQIQLTPSSRWLRGSLVIVRPDFEKTFRINKGKVSFPVLLLIGLEAPPRDYAAVVPAFDDLVERVVLSEDGRGGEFSATTCRMKGKRPER